MDGAVMPSDGTTARAPRVSGNAPPQLGAWLGLRNRRLGRWPDRPGSAAGAAAAAAAIIASSIDNGADEALRRKPGRRPQAPRATGKSLSTYVIVTVQHEGICWWRGVPPERAKQRASG